MKYKKPFSQEQTPFKKNSFSSDKPAFSKSNPYPSKSRVSYAPKERPVSGYTRKRSSEVDEIYPQDITTHNRPSQDWSKPQDKWKDKNSSDSHFSKSRDSYAPKKPVSGHTRKRSSEVDEIYPQEATSHTRPFQSWSKPQHSRKDKNSAAPTGHNRSFETPRQFDTNQTRSFKSSGKSNTSWNQVARWYDQSVGDEGHYYHKHVILPNLVALLNLPKEPLGFKLLDIGCGQGVLAGHLPKTLEYVGLDLSPKLISSAKQHHREESRRFFHGDALKTYPFPDHDFDQAVMLLSLQNMSDPEKAISAAAARLRVGGRLILVLNHPAFRIPKQSSWEVDQEQDLQYRRVNRYLSPIDIPIQMSPGSGDKSEETVSFHHPIGAFVQFLSGAHCMVMQMEEWVSNRTSEGGAAKRENIARKEIPLFMAIVAVKVEASYFKEQHRGLDQEEAPYKGKKSASAQVQIGSYRYKKPR
jgi:ubiquinone/menaquinone biosynthesis C-methylase UbiE